jgi:hypothetical protein
MQFTESRLNAAIEAAKAKAANNPAWLRAIDKAVAGLRGGWIVTELHDGLLITSDSGETYKANGVCSCAAYRNGMACKHRAAARLVEIYNATPEPKRPASAPRVVRSVERNFNGPRLTVYRCDGWLV